MNKNKTKAITQAQLPKNKQELQKFIGQFNYLQRFISNLAGKSKEFLDLKLNMDEESKWKE